jgi:UDP-xylose/UDP-N-acetylglucosamine transporter B4
MTLFFRIDSGSVNMVTFSSFLFIAVEGFAVTTRFGKLRSSVPLTAYITLVVLYFVVSVLNNLALSYNISMPLHMIFKGVSKNQAITNSVFIK